MKKQAVRILCLAISAILLFSLASCGSDNSSANNIVYVSMIYDSNAQTTAAGGNVVQPTAAPTPDVTAATQAPATDAAGQTVATTAAAGTDATATTAAQGGATATTAAAAQSGSGLTSTDTAAVVAFYDKAHQNTSGDQPAGQSKMSLDELDGGSGAVGSILSSIEGIAQSALSKNSTATDYVPGHPEKFTGADCTSATATSDGTTTTIRIDLTEQTDPAKADSSEGTVGHAIGTLGDIDNAINELSGVKVDYSAGTLSLKYYDAYIEAKIDNATNKIVSGTWHYKVYVTIDNVKITLAIIPVTVSGAHAIIDYSVTI